MSRIGFAVLQALGVAMIATGSALSAQDVESPDNIPCMDETEAASHQ